MREKEGSAPLEMQAVCGASKQRSDEILNRIVRTANSCCDRVEKATEQETCRGRDEGSIKDNATCNGEATRQRAVFLQAQSVSHSGGVRSLAFSRASSPVPGTFLKSFFYFLF